MSNTKKILLVCSSGMSTSLLVKAMKKAADSEDYPAEIESKGIAGIEDHLEGVSVVLAGPQIRHRFENLKEICDGRGIPAALIPPQIYGLIDGKKALKLAKDLNPQ